MGYSVFAKSRVEGCDQKSTKRVTIRFSAEIQFTSSLVVHSLSVSVNVLKARVYLVHIQVMIDKEERLALTQMAKKIKEIEDSVTLINSTTKSLE